MRSNICTMTGNRFSRTLQRRTHRQINVSATRAQWKTARTRSSPNIKSACKWYIVYPSKPGWSLDEALCVPILHIKGSRTHIYVHTYIYRHICGCMCFVLFSSVSLFCGYHGIFSCPAWKCETFRPGALEISRGFCFLETLVCLRVWAKPSSNFSAPNISGCVHLGSSFASPPGRAHFRLPSEAKTHSGLPTEIQWTQPYIYIYTYTNSSHWFGC